MHQKILHDCTQRIGIGIWNENRAIPIGSGILEQFGNLRTIKMNPDIIPGIFGIGGIISKGVRRNNKPFMSVDDIFLIAKP